MVAELKATKTQMVWNKPKRRPRPMGLTPSQFEAAVENEASSGNIPGRVAVRLEELSVMDSLDIEKRANENLSQMFLEQGNALAVEGKFGEALSKWEAAIFLTPQKALLHEQKAQVLMEIGRAWGAVQAATTATQIQPEWVEAWVTLARAQLNYGEPACAVESARTALRIDPDNEDANTEYERAQFLSSRQRQAARDSAEANLAADFLLVDGHSRLPSCRRAKVYDADDVGFGDEHPQSAHYQHVPAVEAPKKMDVEDEESSDEDEENDDYDDDDYVWVDEVRRPPLLTDENLLSDFSDI